MNDVIRGAVRGEDERTMEEIMASIGKAVSDETREANAASQHVEPDDILELVDEEPPENEEQAGAGKDRLVSAVAAAASAQAFADLTQAVEQEEADARCLPLRPGGETIEDMVRAMLKPILQEWLDTNLPNIVERLVEEEVRRLSRAGRR